MSTKCLIWLLVLPFFLGNATSKAEAPASNVSIKNIVVTPLPGGQFEIIMTATFTLGDNHSIAFYRSWFTDPNNKCVSPEINFTPPRPGNSANLTAKFIVASKGNWQGGVSMRYKNAKGEIQEVSADKKFTVP